MIDTDALLAQVSKARAEAKALCQETETRLVESARLIDEVRHAWKAIEWPEDLPRCAPKMGKKGFVYVNG